MFVVSFSKKKIVKLMSVLLVVTLVAVVSVVTFYKCKKTPEIKNNTELMVNNSASDIAEIMKFISDFGWEVSQEPDDVREIVIPAEFDEVYEKYNELQLSQGYDLSAFAGEKVKKWCFTIKNYKGYENSDFIKINILVANNQVIGGDVCSVRLDGFMHGFSTDVNFQ